MNNSKESEKSKGVLLFAFNTDKVDYVKIAKHCSRLVHKQGLPVTLVTDKSLSHNEFDNVICIDNKLSNIRLGLDSESLEKRP